MLAALAFNLIFFLQELALVLPKAATPGLAPILYHNNHDWTGANRLAELLQGTGALAILAAGLAALLALRRWRGGPSGVRLLVAWLAFNGLFQSLPQLVIGAFIPQNDVARALAWLGFGQAGRAAAALIALPAMALAGRALVPHYRAFAPGLLRVAILPGLAAIPLILPFRVPGSADQVVLVPVLMIGAGLTFLSLGALRAAVATAGPRPGALPLAWPAAALAILLLFFQLVLRPGIAFS
jgi:hypothetical protein